MGQIACTKYRRSYRQPPSIVKVEGEFNNVYAPDNYHIDSKGQIVDKSTASAVGAANNDLFNDLESLVAEEVANNTPAHVEGDDE